MTYSIELTPKQKEILKIVQADLPDSATPFAEIARLTNTSEQEVLELLTKLKDEGYIRRFGATLAINKQDMTTMPWLPGMWKKART